MQCWEGGRARGAFPALFSHVFRTGSWRSRSLPRCVLTAVHTQVCGFGASFWCLFALSCAVSSVWGTASLQDMLYITALSGRSLEEVVNTCAHWCDSIKAKMEGAVSSLAALALLWWCDLCVFRQRFGQRVPFLEVVGLVEEVAVPCRVGPTC